MTENIFTQLCACAQWVKEAQDETNQRHDKIDIGDLDAEFLLAAAQRISKLECALNNIGRQQLTDEFEDDVDWHALEGAYNTMIEIAREVLK